MINDKSEHLILPISLIESYSNKVRFMYRMYTEYINNCENLNVIILIIALIPDTIYRE